MVRCSGIGRSKGCAVCRRRKVKCDEKQPSCSQCLRLGVSCPGATSNSHVYLLVDDKNPRKHSRLENSPHRELEKTSKGTTSPRDELLIKSIHAVNIHETQIVAQLISYFAKPNITKTRPTDWMIHLLSMISDGAHKAHKSSILSTSLALYSAIHDDDIVYANEARKWYGVSLRRMRGRLLFLLPVTSPRSQGKITGQAGKMNICAEDVSMALMLAYYELFSLTSPDAYVEHILAAGRFLEELGPKMCQGGHLHDLFRTVRFHTLFVSLIRGHPPLLASEEWQTIPFEYKVKTLLDNIVDIITSLLPESLCLDPDTADSMASLLPLMIELHSIKQLLVPATTTTMTKSEGDYEARENKLYGFDLWQYHIPVESLLSSSYQCPITSDSEESVVTVAYYSLAWILVLNRFTHIKDNDGENQNTTYAAILQGHCSSILSAASYMDSCGDGCNYMRMILPLRLVAELVSSDRTQKESSLCRLELWRRYKGFKGNLTQSESIAIH